MHRILDRLRMRKLYLRVRRLLRLRPRNHVEALSRLRHAYETNPHDRGPGVFPFPWGDFEYVRLGNILGQYSEIFIDKNYRFESTSIKPVIIDCGGNVGLSAIWFKQNYPDCTLIVYEPDPNLAKILVTNLIRAGFPDVEVRVEAVWTENTTLSFSMTGDDSGAIAESGPLKVSAIDLAKELPNTVHLLKLDIEGAEFSVIEHLCATGAIQRVACLISEYHVLRQKSSALLSSLHALESHGFQWSMFGGPVPWFGQANESAPFPTIGDKHLGLQVYAWRMAS
jgi:FkbM family methyltransferase